jgi:hypothetical protein
MPRPSQTAGSNEVATPLVQQGISSRNPGVHPMQNSYDIKTLNSLIETTLDSANV